MILRIEDIKEHGLVLELSEPAKDFPVLQEMTEAGEWEFTGPVAASLRAFRVGEMVEVEGQAETKVRAGCSRCLESVEMPLKTHFALTFTRALPEVTGEEGEEVELSAEEMGLIPFEGEEIDLHPFLQEQILMVLPVHPLCREECRGLCPQCGADLNEKDCGCELPTLNKFAVLKNFKVEGRE